jgi:hypothetical protein
MQYHLAIAGNSDGVGVERGTLLNSSSHCLNAIAISVA